MKGVKSAHVEAAKRYARDVLSGKIDACKWVKLACQRFIDDLARKKSDGWSYRLDAERAERACRSVSLFPHVKGKWAKIAPDGTRPRIKLEPWQSFALVNVFGWVNRWNGLRRFKFVYIEVPRKNAKSSLSSAVGLYMLALDNEPGAEVYSAATTRDQARIVFADAQKMARLSPEFRTKFGVDVNAHNINVLRTGSKFQALSAEGDTLDGLNVHLGVIDELHAHKTRAVFDVMETATGARQQPLIWAITTAGSNRAGVCYEQHSYLTKVLDRVAEDETFWGIIYTIDDGDDWTDPASWRKANPNFGVSCYEDDIARLCAKAQQMPSAQSNFLTKRLNVWVNADSAWMDMRAWERAGDPKLTLEQFAGKPCYVGVDLASKIDLAAVAILFPIEEVGQKVRFASFVRHYLPEVAAADGRNSQYQGWEISGRLITTPGDVLDFQRIEDDLLELKGQHDVKEIAYDNWQATQFASQLLAKGAPMVEVPNQVKNFSEPMKQIDALVREGRLAHDGCPILNWEISNVVCHVDAKDNIYPRKERNENKIDGVVAMIMAMNRALANQPQGPSVYESRGLLAI